MPPFGPWPGIAVVNAALDLEIDQWQSDEIDFTVSPQNLNIASKVPARRRTAQWGPIFLTWRLVMTVGAGVCAVAPTFKCGTNGTHDNLAGSQTPVVATINTAIGSATKPCQWVVAASGGAGFPVLDLTNDPHIEVTAPATGGVGFALKGVFLMATQYYAFF